MGALLSRQDAMQDRDRWLSLMQEYNRLSPLDAVLREIQALEREYAEAELLEQEDGFAEMAAQEKRRIGAQMEEKRAELAGLLDTAGGDDRSAIMEIRSGAGGEEAALFAAMLLRMYTRYAEKQGWQTELLDLSPTEMGGVKEAVFSVSGKNVLQRLEGESGVHRIQRIPVTESNGKRQTSTATVAVLPEATDVDVQIDPGDLRIDVYRASGHGGQYINKTDSAVRITHRWRCCAPGSMTISGVRANRAMRTTGRARWAPGTGASASAPTTLTTAGLRTTGSARPSIPSTPFWTETWTC